MGYERDVFRELAALLRDLQRSYPHWEQGEIVSQLRRSMREYTHGIWSVAMPFNRDESALPGDYCERFERLRRRALTEKQLDLAHVFTSIDIRQSFDIVRDVYASWAGDLGTHVLANFARQTPIAVGSADSLAELADLHGDIDGDNIAKHMPEGQPLMAIVAYYLGDEAQYSGAQFGGTMKGVTVNSRYRTFARDLNLLDDEGNFSADVGAGRRILHDRTREFIEFDEIDLDGRHPLQLLSDLLDMEDQARVDQLLDTALDQFLAIVARGVKHERQNRSRD